MELAVTYRRRHPERTPFYQCLEDYWEEFKESYRYFYERDYGPLRPVVGKTVDRFSECGIFRHGFARIRCPECREEYLLAFSCKTRYFCPSCQATGTAFRGVAMGETSSHPVRVAGGRKQWATSSHRSIAANLA